MTTQGINGGQAKGAAYAHLAVERIAAAFAQALAAAEDFVGATAPNPPVGCAVLDADGRVLACQAHQRAGSPHAEVAAIQACHRGGVADRIDTLVVTLEPCNHHGRTAPCVEAILATAARAVWIGEADPNPHVRGGGAARLAAEGVSVGFIETIDTPAAAHLSASARRLIAPFAKWSQTGRPWLTLKQAIAIDGGMVPPAGMKTFTSPASLELAHRLRRRADAIITGSGCVLADDPLFTVRHEPDHPGKRRKLAILDRRGRVPAAYLRDAAARGLDASTYADLDAMLDELGSAGVIEALVEAGPTLTKRFVDLGLCDEQVIIRQSPNAGDADTVEVIRPPRT